MACLIPRIIVQVWSMQVILKWRRGMSSLLLMMSRVRCTLVVVVSLSRSLALALLSLVMLTYYITPCPIPVSRPPPSTAHHRLHQQQRKDLDKHKLIFGAGSTPCKEAKKVLATRKAAQTDNGIAHRFCNHHVDRSEFW
jgi:hypothetical protein